MQCPSPYYYDEYIHIIYVYEIICLNRFGYLSSVIIFSTSSIRIVIASIRIQSDLLVVLWLLFIRYFFIFFLATRKKIAGLARGDSRIDGYHRGVNYYLFSFLLWQTNSISRRIKKKKNNNVGWHLIWNMLSGRVLSSYYFTRRFRYSGGSREIVPTVIARTFYAYEY